jgi:hypothetical protein
MLRRGKIISPGLRLENEDYWEGAPLVYILNINCQYLTKYLYMPLHNEVHIISRPNRMLNSLRLIETKLYQYTPAITAIGL